MAEQKSSDMSAMLQAMMAEIKKSNEELKKNNEAVKKLSLQSETRDKNTHEELKKLSLQAETREKNSNVAMQNMTQEIKAHVASSLDGFRQDIENFKSVQAQQMQVCKEKVNNLNEITIEQSVQISEIKTQISEIKLQSGASQSHITYVYHNRDDSHQLIKFNGEGYDNPIEFVKQCERNMEEVGNNLSDKDRISWIARCLQGSARDWFSIIQDQIHTYQELVEKFQARYWSEQTQRRVRHKLEFGKYYTSRLTKEQYVVRLLAESRHLRPELAEGEIINKLAHHFDHSIKVAIMTRGITKVDDLLIFLSQWDEMTRSSFIPESANTKASNSNSTNNNFKRPVFNNNKNKPARMSAVSNVEEPAEKKKRVTCTDEWPCLKKPRQYMLESKNKKNSYINQNRIKKSVYQISNVYPHDIRGALVDEVFEEEVSNQVESNKKGCPYVVAKINGIQAKILVDTGAEISAINHGFITQNKSYFARSSVLPMVNTQIQTATCRRERVNQQMLINVKKNKLSMDVSVIIIKKLLYDMILGVDVLRKMNAKIDIEKNLLIYNGPHGENTICLNEPVDSNCEVNDVSQPMIRKPELTIRTGPIDKPSHNGKVEYIDKRDMELLLNKHSNIFQNRPTVTNVYKHSIEVTDEKKIIRKTYPIPLHYQTRVDSEIQRMLDQGVIERSNSNFLNPVVVVKKKNDDIRVCLDMRNLNSIVKKNFDCAPNADTLFIKCQGVQYMSRLDLTSSFWQIPLDEGSRKYTAFLYKNKCYQFRVVPFGLSTSLAAIVKCLELALGTEVEDFVNIFVDDILIVSRSYEEHLEHLDIVLKKLGHANLVLNKEKCEFFQREVKFLGHIITPEGIRTDPEKINSITKFPTPNKTKDIRAFLGLTGYYRRFSQKYSETIAPLLDLLKKNQKWRWEPEHEQAFKGVKQIFQKDLHLFHPEEGATYVLYTDASDIAIGGVLYQRMANNEHKVIAYVNRTLKGAEKNYFTSEKEILAVVYALGKFRYYLYGKPFEIHSDNQSLSFMLKSKLGNARMTRWVMAIQEYDFVIKYCKAADNQVADVLSRYPPTIEERYTHRDHDVKILAIQYNIPQDLKQRLRRIQTEQRLDPSIRRTVDQIVQRAHPRYIIHQDILYKWMEDKWRIVLPQHMVEEVTWACHESLAHAGAYRCYLALREDFVWNNMARKIKSTLRTCHQCQTARYPNQHTYVEMGSIVTKGKGEILCLDFLGPLPRASRGNRHLIVCTDAFTKFVKLYPVNRPTTQSVLNAVLKKYIPECGPVKRILTDQGKQFQNKVWADTLTRQGIQPVLTSIRRPQGNLAERVNKEVGKLFRIYCNRQHSSWPQFVKLFEEAINNSHNVTTGYPPIELHTDSKARRMWDKYITRLSSYNVPIPRQVKCQDAGERIRKTADQRAQRFREQHKLVKFEVGERVLLRAANVGKGEDNTATKFFPLYRGPFTLTEQVGKNTFLVYNENNQKCIGKYHGSQLRKYYGRPEIVNEN